MTIFKTAVWSFVAGILATGLSPGTSVAGDLRLKGPLVQGGLVTGFTEPGSFVTVDGRNLRVSDRGVFLIGFGRDAKPAASLHIRHPDASETRKPLQIKQRDYAVQRIDGLPSRKVTPKPEDLARIRNDNAKITGVRRQDSPGAYFASGFQWPATGPVSGVFGAQRILNGKPKNPHNGVDIAASSGSPVTAAADGAVALVHRDMFYTGKTVMINHGHGLSSVYVHMDKILVSEGQRVTKGTPIGAVGKTGRVTGPHLHWGISLFDVHLDPSLLAGPMPVPATAKGG